MSKPRSGDKVIGNRPMWRLWAESTIADAKRGEEFLADGAFTINDFKAIAPPEWTRDKIAKFLEKQGLRSELATDPREYNSRKTRFYWPPIDGSRIAPNLSQTPDSHRRVRRSSRRALGQALAIPQEVRASACSRPH